MLTLQSIAYVQAIQMFAVVQCASLADSKWNKFKTSSIHCITSVLVLKTLPQRHYCAIDINKSETNTVHNYKSIYMPLSLPADCLSFWAVS